MIGSTTKRPQEKQAPLERRRTKEKENGLSGCNGCSGKKNGGQTPDNRY
jgi:hypothetical protein